MKRLPNIPAKISIARLKARERLPYFTLMACLTRSSAAKDVPSWIQRVVLRPEDK